MQTKRDSRKRQRATGAGETKRKDAEVGRSLAHGFPGGPASRYNINTRLPPTRRPVIQRPRFKSHLEFRTIADGLIFVKSEGGIDAIHGKLYSILAPFINGQNTVDDICRLLHGQLTRMDVEFGLEELAQSGYLVESGETEASAFREALGIARPATHAAVSIRSLGRIGTDPLAGILDGLHIPFARTAEESNLEIVLVSDYLDSRIDAYAESAQQSNRAWLLVKPTGTTIWIGPVIQPPRTPCWSCLASRLRARPAFRIEQELRERGIIFESAFDYSLPSTLNLAWNLVGTEIWKWVAGNGQSALDGAIHTLDLGSLDLKRHAVLRRDECPHCGGRVRNAEQQQVSVQLESRRKLFTADGGHRAAHPEATSERLARHISPISGVVSEIESAVADPNASIQVYWAYHNYGFRPREQPERWTVRRRSAGKGMTAAQAKTGALCEALERYSAIFRGNEARRTARFCELGDRAIHPRECLRFSQSQYEAREERNRGAAQSQWIPMPFDENLPVEWSPLWSLTHGQFRYLPTAMCYFNYPVAPDHDFCLADSNGLAAGSSLEDAVLQGFLELIERDSIALWWYHMLRRPAVDLASFRQPYFERLQDYYHAESRNIWALDLTGAFPVTVIAAISSRRPPDPPGFLLGFGAHLNPEIAVARALTEMNQLMVGALAGNMRPLIGDDCEFLTPSNERARKEADFPDVWHDDLRDDVEYLVRLATQRGLETLILDHTRGDVGLHVAKVVVPGLLPFSARFAPGRLYEVPVDLGWLPEPLREGDMNPWQPVL
jgi:bacteriocin biosynthesis cyclodehydratase domain-containing protein